MSKSGFLVVPLAVFACGGGVNSPAIDPPANETTSTTIADVQGAGRESPMAGDTVTVEGIVTGDFQNNDADQSGNLGGFFMQSARPDANSSTSDGIFVFDGNAPATNVTVGDLVSVKGTVREYFGETQIAATSVTIDGRGSASAFELSLPHAAIAENSDGIFIGDLESYEGMLVQVSQTLTVTELFNLERYGEVRLSAGGRLYKFTNTNLPDVDGYVAYQRAIATRTLFLDDGLRQHNASPIRYLRHSAAADTALRLGDSVSGLTGNLRYSRSSGSRGTETWRLIPTRDPTFVSVNPRPDAPIVDGALIVANVNIYNFFSTVDSGARNCGPLANSSCRGADSEQELARQLAKTTTVLRMIGADIIGLVELENNADASLQAIADSLNASPTSGVYAILDTGVIGDAAIRTGFIYRPASVSPSGPHAILDSSVDARFDDRRHRPALAQTFVQNSSGAKLTIVVNHLKSKGSSCDRYGDPNTGDGQANCNQTRVNAAVAIVDWLQTDPTSSNDPDFLIIGDLNAHMQEDPLTTLRNAGYVNLVEGSTGADPYSYVFDGQSGTLDHALVSLSLAPQVTQSLEWHINADEAPAHDYNLEHGRDPLIFDATTPYRASDHDPIIIGLDLN